MKIIVSPAKKLDFDLKAPFDITTKADHLKKSKELISELVKFKEEEIAKLMKISPSLAELNMNRYKSFKLPISKKDGKQAMYAFQGDTYKGLKANDFSKKDVQVAEKTLRILSGLYGILRPMDLILPYRLEMGTKLVTKSGKNLYEFWKDILTTDLALELKRDNDECLVNLASKEYFSSIDFKKLPCPVVTCHFKEKKGDSYKVVGLYAKRARGMMGHYIIKNELSSSEELKNFSEDGYRYSDKDSDDLNFVFLRDN